MNKEVVSKTGLKSEKLDKIMECMYEYPGKDFTIRELEKKIKIPRATVSEYLKKMGKTGLLNKDSLFFKIKKTNYFIERIVASGLVEHIVNEMNPSCIILFGSVRKGESNRESDIDLFVETHLKKKLVLDKYEKKLGHKISLFVEKSINDFPENLFNNVVNGIKLWGSFKIR